MGWAEETYQPDEYNSYAEIRNRTTWDESEGQLAPSVEPGGHFIDAIRKIVSAMRPQSPEFSPAWAQSDINDWLQRGGSGPMLSPHIAQLMEDQAMSLGFAAGTIKTPTSASRGVADAARDRWSSLKSLEDIFGKDLPPEHIPYRQQLIDELKGYHESGQMPKDFLDEFTKKYLPQAKSGWENWSLD